MGRVSKKLWVLVIAGVLTVISGITIMYGYIAPFPYRAEINKEAAMNDVSPYLVAALIRTESHFRPAAVSQRGAVGLMQLMPTSAAWIVTQSPTFKDIRQPLVLSNPTVNIQLGTWYVHHLSRAFHENRVLTLAAYNGGPQTVLGWLNSHTLSWNQVQYRTIPFPETRNFVRRVMLFEKIYYWMYGWMRPAKH